MNISCSASADSCIIMLFGSRNWLHHRKLLRPAASVTLIRSFRPCISNHVPHFHHQDRSYHHQDCRSKYNKKFVFVGVSTLAYYIYKNHVGHVLPTVHAASQTSLRRQHNFIADVVELSTGAVVCIELKDSQRLDFYSWGTQTMSNGSGFIVEEDGLVLTNAHVVLAHPQSLIQVKLSDGTVYPAHIEYIDVNTDLALIRIKPKTKLPTLKLGESGDLRPGEFVIAMGSPLALTNTVTSGIVSATNRKSSELHIQGKDMSYIQTDAAITFGNSGGPLVNLDGEVVGINAMRVAQGNGISFAIPVDYVKEFLERAKSKASHPKIPGMGKRYLGVTMMTLKPEVIQELLTRYQYIPPEIKEGALIWKVVVGSPAYASGVMPGDIVTRINGNEVKSSNSIYEALEKYDVLTMTIFRSGRYYEVNVHPEDVF